ncbi:PilZ domain-containing protein [Pseudoalteromonas denitrificans]|uniref:PilZ domain-containing protein n=1 Tax=Pseudoalteromonas denitrificans DSM 6059 TaxID=1123010 RepID=A0A1I1LA05_9GAMM|nr:PilZ domain-containing protein [Pseudoalteromonas denitrificans]SFC66380.1 PilZ domain-containing protein [Pseudoalteromonas denitrificans DSM 6059]
MLYEDKRNFFRMMVNAQVQINLLDSESGRQLDGVCRDLSATGMSIELDEPLEVNTELKIKVDSTNNGVPSLDAIAKVIRCTSLESQEYLIGLEFIEMN